MCHRVMVFYSDFVERTLIYDQTPFLFLFLWNNEGREATRGRVGMNMVGFQKGLKLTFHFICLSWGEMIGWGFGRETLGTKSIEC
jgi:hypothetical protein